MPSDISISWTWVLAAIVAAVILQELRTRQKRRQMPPGPPGLPLLGNARDIPRGSLGHEYLEMNQKYGASYRCL